VLLQPFSTRNNVDNEISPTDGCPCNNGGICKRLKNADGHFAGAVLSIACTHTLANTFILHTLQAPRAIV
jgi:hypothetical protein